MKRHLLNLLTALSLLLCVAILFVWDRGRGAPYPLGTIRTGSRLAQAYSRSGALHLYWSWGRPSDGGLLEANWEKHTSSDPQRRFDGIGGWGPSLCLQLPSLANQDLSNDVRFQTGFSYLHLPLWLPGLIAGALPACRTWSRFHKRRRTRRGLCPACGYDLRASPGKCPECGRATAGAAA